MGGGPGFPNNRTVLKEVRRTIDQFLLSVLEFLFIFWLFNGTF
jgi:hypothetical protein